MLGFFYPVMEDVNTIPEMEVEEMISWLVIGMLMEVFGIVMAWITEASDQLGQIGKIIYRTVYYLLLCVAFGMAVVEIDATFPELWTTVGQIMAVTYLPPITGIATWLEAIHTERKEDENI